MKSFSFLLYGSIADPRGARRIDHASRGQRAVQTARHLLGLDLPGGRIHEIVVLPVRQWVEPPSPASISPGVESHADTRRARRVRACAPRLPPPPRAAIPGPTTSFGIRDRHPAVRRRI